MRVIDPKRIQKLMVVQDVSTRRLASEVGYASHAYMARILHGEITTVTPERAARIARFLGVGVDDLFVPRLSTDSGHSIKRGSAA